jgi:SAM-dependent methyltransferase
VDEGIRAYYERGDELGRLSSWGWLEFARTRELLSRHLPPAPARVLDVGGGPGAYSVWLAGLGYDVHLVDPVPLHLEQARAAASGSFAVSEGDARRLSFGEGSFDAVLLLGPLYHLVSREERLAALRQAGRMLAPGGVLAAAAISRFASIVDGLNLGLLGRADFRAIVEQDLASGEHRNPTDLPKVFTTSYFHRPEELADEIAEAGLALDDLYAIEGPAGWFAPASPPDEGSEEYEQLMWVARSLEREPALLGASQHLLAVAHLGSRSG